MATVRLVIVLLILGAVLLLAVQNTSVALPLVFLGGQTVVLPLGLWLVLAIALGALTTLVLTALLGTSGRGGGRSKAYKYRPQPFYEPSDPGPAARDAASDVASDRRSNRAQASPSGPRQGRRQDQASDSTPSDPAWQAWTNLQSSPQWNDWEAMGQASQAEGAPSPAGAGSGIGTWLFGNRKAAEQDKVNESWQEISDDWGELEHERYRARGVSPVDDSLEDINQGWDGTQNYGPPPQDFEVPQSPKRVYQDGSLYSYSYRNEDSTGQRDHIYAPPDDVIYGDQGFDRDAYIDLSASDEYRAPADEAGPADYGAGGYEGEALEEPEVAADGVVDADYRVIIPPSPAGDDGTSADAATGNPQWDRDSTNDEDDDEWYQAEDALTP